MNEVAHSGAKGDVSAQKQGFFARIVAFFQQVIAEFQKVQRPTRSELWSMFLTVVSFLIVVMVFVTLLDLLFSQVIFWIFG